MSGTSDGLWLGRFQDPAPIRRRGLLELYACREPERLEPRVVLVAAPEADAATAGRALDAVAEAHARIRSAHVPALDERACAGAIEFASLVCDGAVDLEQVLARLARTGEKAPHVGVGSAFSEALLEAGEAAHAATGRGCYLGALCWANVLLGSSGHPWLLGFGHNFPVRARPGSIEPSPGLCEAPEVALGATPDAASDVWAFYRFRWTLAPFTQLPPALTEAFKGRPLEEYADLARSLMELGEAATSLDPRLRPQTLSELHARFRRQRVEYGGQADSEAMRAFFAGQVAAILAANEAGGDGTVRGGHWHGARYRIDHPVGAGAVGTVFRGFDRQLGQPVAIKVLRPEASAVDRERFRREMRILRVVGHSHLVRGYDVLEEGGRLAGVMELVEGERLDEAVGRGALDPAAVVAALADVADALAALHARGVAHRDVKPANVVVGPGRGAVLVDVGSASALPGDPALTVTGELVGTLGYLAPEQLAGGPATPASDVYGLGMVLLGELERATGVTGDPAERMGSVAERVASLAAPPAVRAALERCLAESPAQRPPAGEVRALLTGAPAVAGPEPAGALRLEDEGRVVHLPDGEVLDLSKRTAPRLILRRLVAHHRARLSRGLSWEELAEAGWPGERMSPDSARGRVYVAVYTLRRLGLDDALLRRDDGYLLDPRLRVAEDA